VERIRGKGEKEECGSKRGRGEGEGIEGAIRKIWEELGVSARIEEIKEIGRDNGKERKMVVVKMEDRKGKMEVMKKKVALRGGVVRVEDDWTREERAMQWKLEQMAKRERRDNRRAWVRYGRIWMEGRWWRWEEVKERVIDGRGEERGWRGGDSREERGEGKRVEEEKEEGESRRKGW